MTEIEIYVVDREGTSIAALPEANLASVSKVLNMPGTAAFNIDPLAEGATEIEGVAREVQIWMDGEMEWQGPPWGLTGNSAQMNVTLEGVESLFAMRFVDRMSMFYTSMDQFSIAWDLLNYAQSEDVELYRDLNIDSAVFQPSGVVRSREWKREEHPNILDCLREFDSRTLANGFDWEIKVTADGGRFWTPYYPRKGEAKPNWAIEWDADGERNVADFTWTENFLSLATLAYVTGGSVSSGDVTFRKEGKYEDVSASAYWGQMQTVVSDGTQLDETWLQNRAMQEVDSRKEPETVISITGAIGLDASAFHELQTGDWVPVKINCGRIQADDWYRIETITWNPNDTVNLEFGGVVVV